LTHWGKTIWLLLNEFEFNGFGIQTGFGSQRPAVTGSNGDSNELKNFAGAGFLKTSIRNFKTDF
jgi:hypothetical protein